MKLIILALLLATFFAHGALAQDGAASQNGTTTPNTKPKITPPKEIESPIPAPTADEGNGPTVFTVKIGIDGLVHDPRMIKSSGSKQADANSLEAIKKWKFKPATKDGFPFPVLINIEVRSRVIGSSHLFSYLR